MSYEDKPEHTTAEIPPLPPATGSGPQPENPYVTLRQQYDRLKAENLKLRRIAAHVPGMTYIKAKEAAGYGDAVTPNTRTEQPGTATQDT